MTDVDALISRAQKRLDWAAIALMGAAEDLDQARALGAAVDDRPVFATAAHVAALASEIGAAGEPATSAATGPQL